MKRKTRRIISLMVCLLFIFSFAGGNAFGAGKPSPVGTISGNVTNMETGAGIAGASIKAGNYTAVTQDDGSYSLQIASGTYTVTCSAPGYVSQSKSATVESGSNTIVEFALVVSAATGGSLSGTVSDSSGSAIAGAVVVTDVGGYTATSDSAGYYIITGIAAGTYNVTCSAAGYTSKTSTATIIDGQTTTLNFTLNSTTANGTLTGKVTDASTKKMLSGAVVTATGAAGSFTGTTNSRGTYTITLPAGTYEVKAEYPGYTTGNSSATVMANTTAVLNFALNVAVVTTGTLNGTVTDSVGTPLAGATVAVENTNLTTIADSAGNYTIADLTAGIYNVTASFSGYNSLTQTATINSGLTTTLNFALSPVALGTIESITASPAVFTEATQTAVTLTAVIYGDYASYQWSQVKGPKAPLTAIDAGNASVDVSNISVAAEAEMVFRLAISDSAGAVCTKDVSVYVLPTDMYQYSQIGGATTAVAEVTYNGAKWSLFNVGQDLKATPVGLTAGPVYTLTTPGNIFNIDIFDNNGQTLALVSDGTAGVAVVDVTDPTAMSLISVTPVNYYQDGITFCDTGGTITTGNIISSVTGNVVDLETDGTELYIADNNYGLHKTALANVLNGPVLEADGTLQINQEVFTLQYAGENPWGGPISLKLYGSKLFASLGALGMGIFDPATMTQVGRYNLYTDAARVEDYFGAMDITKCVSKDDTGDLFLDDFTGMPDYRQVQYEVYYVQKTPSVTESVYTPWSDYERNGKWYYLTQDLDVAQQGTRTIAYLADAIGGVVAVDITGFENATATNFMNGAYLGFFPAVPVNGPYDTNSIPSSLLPYEGAGMLKDAGITGVRVSGDKIFATDHFAGLVILDKAGTPDIDWHGPLPPYNNDTDGIPDNNVPDYEDITSYDMSPWDPLDNESLPWAFYQLPCQLATKELNGHGYTIMLNEPFSLETTGEVDVLECSGAGGFVFVDVKSLTDPVMENRFSIVAYFPTTDEIGAAPDGTPTQTISLGHASGVAATENYFYVSDGPHGVSAWKLVDDAGYQTDAVHLVANTVQDEYPVLVGTELIYPPSHTVRNVIDLVHGKTWAECVGNGMRGVPISDVEANLGSIGAPLLLKLTRSDCYEHNSDEFSLKALPFQDKAYDVEFRGNYAYVADGTNGLTIYDITKDPADQKSGFFVGNIGYNLSDPLLGTASGVELWTDPATGKLYAVIACGPDGVGCVDITDPANMKIIKVFEPIKVENGDIAAADGQAIDVKLIGDKAYFGYDSFGVVVYNMSDLIAPVPVGVDPTNLFAVNSFGTVLFDYRPQHIANFKLGSVLPGVAGGAFRMASTALPEQTFLYVAYDEAGVVKLNITDPANPVYVDRHDTADGCVDVAVADGRIIAGDGAGGVVLFR